MDSATMARGPRTKQPGDIRDDVEKGSQITRGEHGDKIAKCRNLQKLTIRQGAVETQEQFVKH
jgi:hypothetical protein